ncbi:sugar ABC transporter permease [Streptomyces sp. N2-109]|uniref:Xylose transport system permease protein XylH n=1 Tax=Streptomyces gossypii TaxID=2883101 RepID=A0ABT2JSH5_9ACTN|nr:sugar ABC transporter permease [Streptomyces gossypii]MCT2590837.1 sugar ABC transporter permease [Streptomyces gossypii]
MSDLKKTGPAPAEEAAADAGAEEQAAGKAGGGTNGDGNTTPGAAIDPRLLVREQGFKGYLTDFQRRIRGGELGSLPVIVGLIIIAIVFQSQNDSFLSASSLSNISVYTAGLGIMAIGVVFVLLLGEIDLSIGSVAGVGAAMWAVLSVTHGLNDWLAVLLAVALGGGIGLLHGFFFAKVGVPAFVVTLAGFLGWSGLQIWLMGDEGSINTPAGSIVQDLTGYYFADKAAAYALAAVAVLGYFASLMMDSRRRRAAELPFRPMSEILLRTGVLTVIAFVIAYELNEPKGARGLPLALVIFLAILVFTDFVSRRTLYGRQIFAVGGNAEAARRAGINVEKIRITVFGIAGMLAVVGGLFIASQSGGANKSLGADNTLMNVIAAAVIGGTSLFGGRGKIWSALLGALVIMSIQQGLDLMGMASEIQFMITGAVLLAAVVIDSVSRRTQKTAGRT